MESNKSSEIQNLIKAEREKQGLSIRKFAQRIGCASRSVLYWDRGERTMSIEMADKALKELGLTIELGKSEGN